MLENNGKTSGSAYRWYILTLSALTFVFTYAIPTMSLPVLFKEISEDLNLSLVQLGTVWGIAPLAAVALLRKQANEYLARRTIGVEVTVCLPFRLTDKPGTPAGLF